MCRRVPEAAVVVDGDTGHGNALNTIGTVELFGRNLFVVAAPTPGAACDLGEGHADTVRTVTSRWPVALDTSAYLQIPVDVAGAA